MGLFLRDYEAAGSREINPDDINCRQNHFLNQHHLFVKFCFEIIMDLKETARDNREGGLTCLLFGCHGWLHLVYLQSNIKPSKATDAVWVSISMLFCHLCEFMYHHCNWGINSPSFFISQDKCLGVWLLGLPGGLTFLSLWSSLYLVILFALK